MDESRPLFPLADNEIAYLKSIEAFLRGRCILLSLTSSLYFPLTQSPEWQSSNKRMFKAFQFGNGTDCRTGFWGYRRCSKARLLYPNASYRGIVRSRSYSVVLKKVRLTSARLNSRTEKSGRTADSNGRTRDTGRPSGCCGSIDRQGCK